MVKRQASSDAVVDEVLTVEATHDHVIYCFHVLIHHLKGGHPPTPTFDIDIECPLFVTWEKDTRAGSRHLRGCIGTLRPRRLAALRDYVYSSAFRDRRFSPISASELSQLRCSVSLLVDYQDAADVYDWEVGVHGIIIDFTDKGAAFNATYLPEVAAEQRWSKVEALESLVRKAGFSGRISEAFWKDVRLTRYRSSKTSLHYTEFTALLENAPQDSNGGKPHTTRRIPVT